MKKIKLVTLLGLISACLSLNQMVAQTIQKLSVLANKPLAEVQPAMWGIFFEDINFAADGGIYAELVKNRSFEFTRPLMGWKELKQGDASGSILIINQGDENPNNPRFARVTSNTGKGVYGLTNEGFRGIGVSKGKQLDFSVFARQTGEGLIRLKIELINSAGNKIGEASLSQVTEKWQKYSVSFVCTETDAKAKLNVILEGKGTLDLDMISLFPHDTWKGRANGLRADLVQMLADLKPGFIRFPGGCIVEGFELATRYQWKKTIGKPEDRKLIINRWNTEFADKSTPDYFQSYGLGFFEYFLLCEDIGAEPLPILSCGMACQFNSAEVVPLNQLDSYIQDALDLIEFANGRADSKWGKIRSEMGHSLPFNMKLLGIGNEQWDVQYVDRYKAFAKVLKEKYPAVKLISSVGPSPDGKQFEYLSGEMKKMNADFVDEHYYKEPAWFLKNASRYDHYDRKGPKIFAGEYAAHSKADNAPESRNNWESALAEAAFMTGLERNSDMVQMASYAPLFGNVEAWQWRPDLIWFDNLRVARSPNYYVQKLFSNNKGTNVVPILKNGLILAGADSIYGSAVIDKKTNEVIIKLVNTSSKQVSFEIAIEGVSVLKKPLISEVLSASNPMMYNSLDKPDEIIPIINSMQLAGNKVKTILKPCSVTLLKVPCKKL